MECVAVYPYRTCYRTTVSTPRRCCRRGRDIYYRVSRMDPIRKTGTSGRTNDSWYGLRYGGQNCWSLTDTNDT